MPLVLVPMSHHYPHLRDPFTHETPPPYTNDFPQLSRADSIVEPASYASPASSSPETTRPGSWSSAASATGALRRRRSKAHTPNACNNCKRAHLGCDSERPCKRCCLTGKQDTCTDVPQKRRGRPRLRSIPTTSPILAQQQTLPAAREALVPTALLAPDLSLLSASPEFTTILGPARSLADIVAAPDAAAARRIIDDNVPGQYALDLTVTLATGTVTLGATLSAAEQGWRLALPPIERGQLAQLAGQVASTPEGESPVKSSAGEMTDEERVEAERRETRQRMRIGSLLG